MGALALGPGAITQYEFQALGIENHLYTNFHLGLVPLAGKNKAQGVDPDTETRDYNFGWGGESKLEVALNVGNITTLALAGYYYYLQTYEKPTERTFLGILKPKIYFTVYRNIKVGYEQTIQYDKVFSNTTSGNYNRHTEQKAFIMVYLEDKQRKGRYN
jgi:hypothetical protein